MRSRGVRALATAASLLVALPCPAGAQSAPTVSVSFSFKPPTGWVRSGLPVPTSTFIVRDGDKVHTLSIGSAPPKLATDVETYAAEQIATERQRGSDITDEGPSTVCDGQAAHRYVVRSASTGVAMETHYLIAAVTGGVATAAYGHKQGVGDRRDALEAMNTLCPGPVPNPVPAGWTAPKTRPTSSSTALDSPDGTSTFIASYRPMNPEYFDTFERDAAPSGKVIADKREPCGPSNVHRIDVQVGGQIAEISVAYVRRIAYKYVYTRPAAHDADAGAERALTAFCRASGPLPEASTAPA